MIRNAIKIGFTLTALFLVVGSAAAGPIGANITKWDGNGYLGIGAGGENNETEPGAIASQVWDLEAFYLQGNSLSMVGGFDFKNGNDSGGHNYGSGDIFLDVNGDANYYVPGSGTGGTQLNTFGWDYAIRMSFGETNTYTVWQIFNTTMVKKASDIAASNPWMVDDTYVISPTGAPAYVVKGAGTFEYFSVTSLNYEGLASWSPATPDKHYIVSGFDLGGFLPADTNFTSHFTVSCGNDNLIGAGTTVPEPATLLLLGFGLAGLAGYSRMAQKK